MSLFICQSCKCVENTNLVKPDGVVNEGRPNMSLMQMDGGHKDIIHVKISTKNVFGKDIEIDLEKHPKSILRLCSECNTGTWHGEFDKRTPEPKELLLSMFSKTSSITPYDHSVDIIPSEKTSCGYEVNPIIYRMLKQSSGDLSKHPLFPIYVKYRSTFKEEYLNIIDEIGVKEEYTEEEESRLNTAKINAMGSGIKSTPKKEEKVKQRDKLPKETQEELIRKAEEKRKRKAAKKES